MNECKIKWCAKQARGISLINPKPHLSEAYINEADDTLENVFSTKGKWKLITAYYACYHAFYAILMKCGIKCEIHDCSLELMNLFDFEKKDVDFLKTLKEDRIQIQYYLKKKSLDNESEVKKFILKCKRILDELNSERIEECRKKLKGILG